ncbi:MAG: phosphotransferase [Legionellales bacterium]|nr:phosphotransferase [Legionellales bacterium]
MGIRQNELNSWLKPHVKTTPMTLTPLAGDASFRRYFRLTCGPLSYVVMDAPPEKESIASFLGIGHLLARKGVHTPKVHAVDKTLGFMLLEDLGDTLLIQALSPDTANGLYAAAMETLRHMQQCPTEGLPLFDKAHMHQELSLFREWFLKAYLGLQLTQQEDHLLNETFFWLTTQLALQPQVFIHRDFHARNIMICKEDPLELGVIDFQDAMAGPFTYDLVSLLKDCYIQWPREQVLCWLTEFYHQLPQAFNVSLEDFIIAFDLCGLQRHLKVLGIFCRLHLRDHKAAYLNDLPLTFRYVMTCLSNHPKLQAMSQWMQHRVHCSFSEKSPA